MTVRGRVTSAYGLWPARRPESLGAGLNCSSLSIQIGKDWVVFSIFPWDSDVDGGLPGLCTIELQDACETDVAKMALASMGIGGYTPGNAASFKSIDDLLPVCGMEFVPNPDQPTSKLGTLHSAQRRLDVGVEGNLVTIRASTV